LVANKLVMRILQLCNKPPYPAVDGGTIAMHAITQGLLDAGHSVKVLAIETAKHPFKKDKAPAEYLEQTQAEAVFLDTAIKPLALLGSFINGGLYIISRFTSAAFTERLTAILKENTFDAIILESLFVAPYINTIRQHSKAKIILRAHNVEHLIWQRMLDNEGNVLKLIYLKKMVAQLKAYEVNAFAKVDGIAAISSIDAGVISKLCPQAKTATINLSTNYIPLANVAVEANTVFHLGSMDWQPNLEGIEWFISNVWPLVITKNKSVKLHLAGRNMPAGLLAKTGNSIIVEGAVESPAHYMAARQVMVVPLFSGSGVRVKIIEGMALGKAIVATPVAIEGIDVTNAQNILIADTAQAFANAILTLLESQDKINTMGQNAAHFIDEHYRSGVIIKKLEDFIKSV
jgi:polysaccharide biosynthesis protein PslH